MEEGNKWYELWEARGEKINEFDPVKLDGFDSGAGVLTSESLKIMIEKIRDKMELNCSDDFLEVGCGAGMLLIPLSKFVRTASGVDYSSSLIEKLKKNWGGGILKIAEARDLPFKCNSFNKVLANSIFQYFPSYEYAAESVQEMTLVCRKPGIVYISDVPDITKKDENDALRKKIEPVRADNTGLQHRFYGKDFFEKVCRYINMKCEISDQDIAGYENSRFRFNILIRK